MVLEGITPPAAPAERRALSGSELAAGQRLACRVPVVSGMKVDVPKASLITGQRLQLAGPAGAALIDAAVRSLPVHAEPPTLRDQRSDFDRLAAAAAITHGVRRLRAGPDVLRQLTPLARRTGWELSLLVRGDEVIGALAPGRRAVGLAIDLGTTKIAGYLLDLGTGAELAADGLMNPQIAYGEDVVSRLAHAVRTEHGADDLARVVREGIDALVGTLCRQAGMERDAVADGCVVANTAMHHLLLGLPTRQLAAAPFVAATSAPRRRPGARSRPRPGTGRPDPRPAQHRRVRRRGPRRHDPRRGPRSGRRREGGCGHRHQHGDRAAPPGDRPPRLHLVRLRSGLRGCAHP